MERLVKIGTTLRNNWKKSVCGAVVLYYGAYKAKERYEINILMHAACKEASQYGEALIPMDRNPTSVTVILNPVANKRSARKEYERYCEPLLHLAGLQVDVIQTTSEGNAKEIIENLKGTEAIIVAGGDGTLSETVTGLLRRNDDANRFPLGILPLGKTNTLANTMFPDGKGVNKVKQLIEASMAIIKGDTVWKDAIKIEPIVEGDEPSSKPIYALTSIEWGAFRDVLAMKDKYWIYGPWRALASFIFNGYKKSLTWECSGTIKFTPPCAGCSNCVAKKPKSAKRWSFFVTNATSVMKNDASETVNSECSLTQELCFKTCDFRITSPNLEQFNPVPSLSILLGKYKYTYIDFVSEGLNRLKGKDSFETVISARTVEILPRLDKKDFIEIDHEEFEVKPVKISLMPKVIKLFCKPRSNNNNW